MVKENKAYKYNIFSIIDEPWNRWRAGGKCERTTGNECIARGRTRSSILVNREEC